jgi:predicted metal-dependent HD superfamily phosphohydrolase
MNLKTQWNSACINLGLSLKRGGEVYQGLLNRYSESHRHYHTLNHIGSAIKVFNTENYPYSRDKFRLWSKGFFTLMFHDAIYDPKSDKNEYNSATLAYESLDLMGLGHYDCQDITLAIRFKGAEVDCMVPHLVSLTHDADWSILSAPQSLYDEYAANVQKEFSFVTEKKYIEGRIKFLEETCRDLTYSKFAPTNITVDIARENMRREQEALRRREYDQINYYNHKLTRSPKRY